MTIHPVVLLHRFNVVLMATLKPMGIWGLGSLAFIDAGLFPLPTTMDGVLIGYVAGNHGRFFLYCLMAAAASALGSLIPYYVGRAGGELFLLKRINRQRYERMRDRFERQEFLAIMVPAMCPPPMPIKLFEFGAGVFEMKPLPFVLAIFAGKFIQFLACAVITVLFGPKIVHAGRHLLRQHSELVVGIAVAAALAFLFYVLRKVFDRKKGTPLPMEDSEDAAGLPADIDSEDSTLIT